MAVFPVCEPVTLGWQTGHLSQAGVSRGTVAQCLPALPFVQIDAVLGARTELQPGRPFVTLRGGIPMFEAEMELEKRTSSFGPLLMVAFLIIAVVGGLGYFLYQQKRGLPKEEAAATVTAILNERGPATVSFHVGDVVSSIDDSPTDPHYRLLQKAGILKIAKAKGRATPIALTPEGEKQITEIPEFAKVKEEDGTLLYRVPLAQRKLISIDNVKMLNPSSARVDYTWKWESNALGTLFDASGKSVKSFATYDRAMLIEKHGADFYGAAPTKNSIVLVKGDKGWKVMQE